MWVRIPSPVRPSSPAAEAADLKSVKREFESHLGYAPLAQSVEQLTFNQRVVGSSPTWRTVYTKTPRFATEDGDGPRQASPPPEHVGKLLT